MTSGCVLQLLQYLMSKEESVEMKLVLPLLVSSSNSKFPATTKPISNSDYKAVNVNGNKIENTEITVTNC